MGVSKEAAMFEPFAVQIYRRHLNGETVKQLAVRYGIPPDRIELRLRAAAAYVARQGRRAA